jgi:hypothetical protein
VTNPDLPTDDTPRPPPSSLRYRIGVGAALVVACLALVAGVRATRTDDPGPTLVNGRPDVVEHVVPRAGAEALQQSEVGVDLVPGHEGALSVNGTAIPDDELRRVPEQNQVFFAPGQGRTFEALPAGRTCVTATIWRSAVGRGPEDTTFQWCFDVT